MTPTNLTDYLYFRLIYNWMGVEIDNLSKQMVQNTVQWISFFALILVTLWVFLQGYRLVTGQMRESAMTVVSNMIKIALVVTFATTVSLVNNDVRTFVTQDMSNAINYMVNGSSSSMTDTIDKNLAYTQMAMAAIDTVQVPYGDENTASEKARTMMIATLGTAGPAMTAGAMLLLYQVAIALVIGLAPLFILCLIFDQTKDLFKRWVMFTVSTLFSMAVLNAVVAIALKASINTAEALWVSQAITHITNLSAEGFNSQALQQGGVGLLMTVLIISTPPMAGMLFNGTLGQFVPFAQVGGGGVGRPGPQGQPAGSYNWSPPPSSDHGHAGSGSSGNAGVFNNHASNPPRSYAQAAVNKDEMKYRT
ncbi:type IV secretion system protein VirB6 [Dyella sp. OK004]|uniref:type IV secretion system protein n=1 Tax=Dyella sp. OK004 TaxID=1855292 RepID=UPI0008E986A8|nr:type IV secretion system protein [Dyella sp. OK004]SFR90120.1 type IV secretion system protein VirB6 [Dyella sp. OK004]